MQIFIVQAVRYLCSCEKERGASILSSVIKRRIRDGESFEFPDYVFDMHTVKGQAEHRGIEQFFLKRLPKILSQRQNRAKNMLRTGENWNRN